MSTNMTTRIVMVLCWAFFSFMPVAGAVVLEDAPKIPGRVLIPEGPFMMGSTEVDIKWIATTFSPESLEWYQDETPARQVYLNAYYMDKYEVTNAEYVKFRKEVAGREPKYSTEPKFNKHNHPVVGISWQDAADYCKWADGRLPTEAEWEKAARGADARYYPWGNKADPVLANVRGMEDDNRYTAPVGDYEETKSPYGIHDLAGNVWEWTADWYQPYKGNHQESDMYGELLRVIKGGSWQSNMDLARSAIRGKAIPDQPQNYIGFRCVRDL